MSVHQLFHQGLCHDHGTTIRTGSQVQDQDHTQRSNMSLHELERQAWASTEDTEGSTGNVTMLGIP